MRPIYRLRSVRADHAHVEVVAQLHLQLGLPVLIGPVRRYRWRWRRRRRTGISLAIPLASGRPILLALSRVVMVVMSGVPIDRQSGVRGLAAVGLVPGGQRRRRRLMATTGRDSVLKSGLQSPYPIVRLSGGELRLRVRRTAQRVTGVMGSRAARRDSVDRRCAQRRCTIVHHASDPSSPSATSSSSSSPSSAVTGRVVRDGQRSRAAHLARRFAVDVGEALGKSGAAVRQEPDPTGPGARCPKF